MQCDRLQAIAFGLFLAGLVTLAMATAQGHDSAVRWAGTIYGLGIAAFTANMGLILDHFRRTTTTPWNHAITPRRPTKSMASSDPSSIPSLG
jgi:hypothetical protein